MNTLFILNDAAYNSERAYNVLRLAEALSKQNGNTVRVFLICDGSSCSHRNQKVPKGFYNIEVKIGNVTGHSGDVGICGTCMDARGIAGNDISEGTLRSILVELTEWTVWADRVLVY